MEVALDFLGDPNAPIGSREWARDAQIVVHRRLKDTRSAIGLIKAKLNNLKKTEAYKLLDNEFGHPFASFEQFVCTRFPVGLGFDLATIEAMLHEPDRNWEKILFQMESKWHGSTKNILVYQSAMDAGGFWFCLDCHITWHGHFTGGDQFSWGMGKQADALVVMNNGCPACNLPLSAARNRSVGKDHACETCWLSFEDCKCNP